MRKFLGIVVAGLMAFSSANASPILVDPSTSDSNVDAQITSSNCWGCFVDASLSDGLDGSMALLDIGDSFTFDFFDITVGGLIGSAQVEVAATLGFDSPDVSTIGNGVGAFATFLYVINGGYLNWVQPESVYLGDGTYLGVSFENLFEFGIGNTTTVSATINRFAGAAPVPEPGTAALLAVGLLALWLAASRRRPISSVRRPLLGSAH